MKTENLTTLNGLIAKPQKLAEPDLLIGNEHKAFVITDLDDNAIVKLCAPHKGWDHESLASIEIGIEIHRQGLNYYLGDQWVGTTEL